MDYTSWCDAYVITILFDLLNFRPYVLIGKFREK